MGKRVNTAVWMDNQKRWQIKVQKDGERRAFYSSAPGRTGQREANKKADDWLDNNIARPHMRVNQLYPEFLETLKSRSSASNWTKMDSNWRNHINPIVGRKKFENLVEQDLQDILDKAYAKKLSKGTLKGIRATLSAFMKFARKERITTIQTSDLVIPQNARYQPKKILQPSAFLLLMNNDQTTWRGQREKDPNIHAYRFHAITGMRPGELIGMRPCDIRGKVVELKRAINALGEETKGKNNNAVRTYVMPQLAYDEYLAQLEEYPPDSPDASLWHIDREPTYMRQWKRYCEANKIEYVPPYRLRNTFISLNKKGNIDNLKRVLGHEEDFDTLGVYGVDVDGELKMTADDIDESLTMWLEYAKIEQAKSEG